LKDGVTLAPEDGLSNEEARWVHKNYAAYFAQQVPFYRAGLGRGDIIVNEKETAAPIDPLFDNIFTHGFWGVSAPLYDPKFAYWQCNLNDGMWCSGELYESYPQAYYDYVLPISRLTCVNLERPMVKDLRFLKAAYGNGLAFVTLFNALPGDEKFVRDLFEFNIEMAGRFAQAQMDAGADIIGMGDAAASLVGPKVYQEFVLPREKKMVDAIHAMGAPVRLHICGNTRRILEGMGKTGCDMIDLDLAALSEGREKMGPNQVLLGNIHPVHVLRDGTPESVYAAIGECHRQAGPHYIIGAGCEVPRGTPLENMMALVEYAKNSA
jgi:hypothetical protein